MALAALALTGCSSSSVAGSGGSSAGGSASGGSPAGAGSPGGGAPSAGSSGSAMDLGGSAGTAAAEAGASTGGTVSMAGGGGVDTGGTGGEGMGGMAAGGGTFTCMTETSNGMHSHPLTIPGGDVDRGYQDGPYLLEDGGTGHTHMLEVSAYEFIYLRAGVTRQLDSTTDAGHHHTCVITCSLG